MTILNLKDTVNGGQGFVQIELEGNLETLFQVKNVEAYLEKNKEALPVAGSHWEQSKLKTIKGTGSCTIYHMSSMFVVLAQRLAKEGKDFDFDMIITNEDKNSSVGKQTTVLRGCNMDKILLAKFDTDSAALEEDFDFTFSDMDVLNTFKKPSYF
ncbi:phage tail tube protein [[Clostridium] innocuum]|nr:phage tail tube protein [[Clostridium] innocuum]MCR0577076.1 phage tail tube protein [[Clostridium] innocuum]